MQVSLHYTRTTTELKLDPKVSCNMPVSAYIASILGGGGGGRTRQTLADNITPWVAHWVQTGAGVRTPQMQLLS